MMLFSIITNRRILLDPIFEVVSTFSIIAIGVRDGQEQRHHVELFFRLGTPVKRNGVWTLYFQAIMGSGNTREEENRFFPEALQAGTTHCATGNHFWTNDTQTRQLHGCIAKTYAFLSILSYQTNQTIVECMRQARMLPNVDFYNVTTGPSETDLNVFVYKNMTWAVFCF